MARFSPEKLQVSNLGFGMLRQIKVTTFMWCIWHKDVATNEWRAHIALASIFNQCVFLPL